MKEAMKEIYKLVKGWFVGLLVSLYVTFAIQTLWNWFVPAALHVESISYWNTYGLLLVISVIRSRYMDMREAHEILKIRKLVDYCIPEERRAETILAAEEDPAWKFLQGGFVDGIRVAGVTIWLLIGFGVHTFLM